MAKVKVESNPGNPSVVTLTYTNDSGEAIATYTYVVSMNPDNPGFALSSWSK
jgi:hypothetical protein